MKKIMLILIIFMSSMAAASETIHDPLTSKEPIIINPLTDPQGNNVFHSVIKIQQLIFEANQCITQTQMKLDEINKLINSTGFSQTYGPQTPDYKYFYDEKLRIEKKNAQCAITKYKLENLKTKLNAKSDYHIYINLFEKSLSFYQAYQAFMVPFNMDLLLQNINVPLLKRHMIPLITLFILMILSLSTCLCTIKRNYKSTRSTLIKCLLQSNVFIVLLPTLLSIKIYLYFITPNTSLTNLVTIAIDGLCLYSGIAILIRCLITRVQTLSIKKLEKIKSLYYLITVIFCLVMMMINFHLANQEKIFIQTLPVWIFKNFIYILTLTQLFILIGYWSKKWAHPSFVETFTQRLLMFIALFFCYKFSLIFLQSQLQPYTMMILFSIGYLTLLNMLWLWTLSLIFKHPYFSKSKNRSKKTIGQTLLIVLTVITIIAGWQGYLLLGKQLLISVVCSIMSGFIMYQVSKYLKSIYIQLSNQEYSLSKKFRALLSISPTHKLFELYLLRIFYTLMPMVIICVSLLILFGLSKDELIINIDKLRNGFTIFNVTISPILLLRGGYNFCAFMILGRILIAYIERNKLKEIDKHTRITITSFMKYLNFTFALLTALIIAGVDFKGIAIIAGALSVGLGFGLQHFISDFVSGILLMINKPIQIGDHVVIDDTEGFIKKIGLLSTQLRTLVQTDVIIPNSNLIIKSVTNFTFQSNRYYRLAIQITLNDSNQLEMAQSLLLALAQEESGIVQDPPNAPSVTFDFNRLSLWFVLEDVNQKQFILSSMNLKISRKFKENNIAFTN